MSTLNVDDKSVRKTSESDKEEKAKRNESSVRKIISDYGERTTLHGLHYLIHGRSFVRRFMWLCFIIFSFSYFMFTAIKLLTNFFEYQTMTKNEIIIPQRMLFPAITICNYNPIRKSAREKFLQKYLNKNISATNSEARPRRAEGNNSHDDPDEIIDDYIRNIDIETLYQSLGHTMAKDGMLASCKWKGMPCSEKDFRTTVQGMGLCHTFNSGE